MALPRGPLVNPLPWGSPMPVSPAPRGVLPPRTLAHAAILGVALALGAPARAMDGLILTADFGDAPVVRVMDPTLGNIVYDYDLTKEPSEGCDQRAIACAPLGVSHTRHGDEDFIDMALAVFGSKPKGPAVKVYSVVQRVRPALPRGQVVWKIKTLDFSGVPEGLVQCDPTRIDSTGALADPRCYPQLVHSIQVVDDHPADKTVSVVMAEMDTFRVTRATLDYASGGTEARVDWVLGRENPDWPRMAFVNAAQYIDDQPGGPYLLTTFYTATAEVFGGGLLMLWRWNGADWEALWRFPEDVADRDALPLLNTPHMGEHLVDPISGRPWVIYSHSRGTAGDWATSTDYGGSFGVLELGASLADPPTYRMDVVLRGDDPARETQFSRDVDFLADGTLLLTDAACEDGVGCNHPARLFWVEPFFTAGAPTTQPGWYAPDERYLNRYDLPNALILDEIQCGFGVLFEAELLPTDRLGSTLRDLARQAHTPCAPPE